MKKLLVLLVMVSFIVGSLFSTMHSHASSLSDNNTVQIVQSLNDDSHNHGSSNSVECEQCCHAGCHIVVNNQSVTYYTSASSKRFVSSDKSYLSQLNSPPFQPPRT